MGAHMRPHFVREAPSWREIASIALCGIGLLVLFGLNLYELGYEKGKRDQVAAFACPSGEAGVLRKKVDVDGSITCYYGRYDIPTPIERHRRNTYRRGAV